MTKPPPIDPARDDGGCDDDLPATPQEFYERLDALCQPNADLCLTVLRDIEKNFMQAHRLKADLLQRLQQAKPADER
jgi:hypothetical protein